jgi:hypothetical protein
LIKTEPAGGQSAANRTRRWGAEHLRHIALGLATFRRPRRSHREQPSILIMPPALRDAISDAV